MASKQLPEAPLTVRLEIRYDIVATRKPIKGGRSASDHAHRVVSR